MAKNFYANSHPAARKEIKRLIEGVNGGDRLAAVMLTERMGTVDGMFAFADITNRVFQDRYAEAPAIWTKFASRSVVSDFREVQYYSFNEDLSNFKAADKGVTRAPGTLPKVAEGEKYQAFALGVEQALGFKPEKHGAQIGLTWEAFVNDPWNTVPRIPSILTRIAAKTVDAKALGALYTAANAQPHVAAMTAANSPISIATPVNAPLTFESLTNAWAQLKNKKDVRNNAVVQTGGYVLVVSPGLRPKADAILAQNLLVKRTGVDANNFLETSIVPTLGNIEVVEAPLLSFFAGNDTTWILAPAGGGTDLGDPAVLVTFLAGEETPEIRVSGLAGYTPNGNSLPFTSGSFDTDTFDLRVRHVTGAGSVNPLPLILSNGTGV